MGLFGSFSTGVSGLNAHHNSLNTTAHNLTNVETKGYVRQQVVHKDSFYSTIGSNSKTLFQIGKGVDIATVRQVRDVFLDKSYRLENGRQQFYQVQYEAVLEIENILGEMEGVAFQKSLEDLWTSLQELSKEPDSIVARTSLVQSSVSFVERAGNIWSQLKDYQLNLNTQIVNEVNRINQIADEINILSDQIRYHESNGLEKANDYRDIRNLLLDELGNMISISYNEDSNNELTVYAEGVPLITPEFNYKMEVKAIPGTGMLLPVWGFLGDQEVFNLDRPTSSQHNTDIGSLKGLLVTRGAKVANYTDIPVMKEGMTEEEFKLEVLNYNNQVETSLLMTSQARFDQLIHSVTTTINDILSPNTRVEYLTEDGEIATGYILSSQAPMGMDLEATVGTELFSRMSLDRYEDRQLQIIAEDGTISLQNVRFYNEEDRNNNYSLYSIEELEINSEILENYSKIPLSAAAGTGDYDMTTVQDLVDAWRNLTLKLSPNTLTEYNFNGYYAAFVAETANKGQQLNTISMNQESMVNSIDNLRQKSIGVSSDEELTNLIKFQHSYNAAARYISVIDEMIEHVIERLGH